MICCAIARAAYQLGGPAIRTTHSHTPVNETTGPSLVDVNSSLIISRCRATSRLTMREPAGENIARLAVPDHRSRRHSLPTAGAAGRQSVSRRNRASQALGARMAPAYKMARDPILDLGAVAELHCLKRVGIVRPLVPAHSLFFLHSRLCQPDARSGRTEPVMVTSHACRPRPVSSQDERGNVEIPST